MKAMVLAAGRGTRLQPLTNKIPKCLMSLAGEPLLGWTLRWLKGTGVEECVINLHHHADKVRKFVGDGSKYNLRVYYSYEPTLLGTAGAVKKIADFFADEPFYVIYGDNFSQWDIRKLQHTYEYYNAIAAVAVHWRKDVTQSGMVEIDEDNKICSLIEKPSPRDVISHYVSAGFFYLSPKVLNYIPDAGFCDFGFHVLPALIRAGEQVYAVKMDNPIIGIDTKQAYEKANDLALRLISQKQ